LKNPRVGATHRRTACGCGVTEGVMSVVSERSAIVKEAFAQLVRELETGGSEALTRYLEFAARFYCYSSTNQVLIYLQRPTATRVAGSRTWAGFGRFVRDGASPISIYAPSLKKGELKGFVRVKVYDVGQTDGAPMPASSFAAGGHPGPYLSALEAAIGESGTSLTDCEDLGGALGASLPGQIKLLCGLRPADRFAVLTHEFAHELLHRRKDKELPSLTVRETEAEAISYVVSKAIGVSASIPSIDYIRSYRGDPKTLKMSLKRIQSTARRILKAIEVEPAQPKEAGA
jgi:hypothetical protein